MKPNSYNLRVEPLEDRILMSTCHVTRLTDMGVGKGFRGDLRYCINKVNAEPGPDVIDFTVTGVIHLTDALPPLDSDIDIQGPGADLLTVRRDTGGAYRIFTVNANRVVKISRVTITNGFDSKGGGIYNAGVLSLHLSTIWQNKAGGAIAFGGGIYNDTGGQMTIDRCQITDNEVSGVGSLLVGGGIYNHSNATLTITYSTISDNRAGADDPGSAFRAEGGGVYNWVDGIVTITRSTIANNIAYVQGESGFYLSAAVGGGVSNYGPATISHSTVINNTTLSNVTGSGSQATRSHGGGIYVKIGPLDIRSSTIAKNSSIGSVETFGGGLYVHRQTPTVAHLRNSIIAYNIAPLGSDLKGQLTTSAYNLIGNAAGGSGFASTDLLNIDPLLGPLADNNGPTLTHALLPDSPAIGAGDNTDAPEWDQRGPGFPRIVNGTIDIGAFEVQATPMPSSPRAGYEILALILATADLDTLI